ncbi:hypothetical protein QYE76_062309 [Lolium multiflorum]|uniref:Uncharacterized protein n=1 Tax=Lolium multiflorum TaxID=4521 RepID=A0AAD8S2T3_LOLMU|nr:hypothetical protein QYE76_062309 [Lolium multiflorum]
MKMKLVRVIVGLIELRCCLVILLMGRILTDLLTDNGERKLFERDTQDKIDGEMDVDPINTIPLQDNSGDKNVLAEVHKSVTKAFAPSVMSPGQASSSASASTAYTQFLHTLIKSGSDKAFTIQKQYRKELGPILEEVNEEDVSEEQVD